jgi:multiple sugar transport system substrate-binding protein
MNPTPEDRARGHEPTELFERPMSRREMLRVAGASSLSLSLLLAGCGGGDEGGEGATGTTPTGPGGPRGWQGAERYQYAADSAPGRAAAAAKKLRQDGQAPDTIVVAMHAGAIGNYEQPFPEGAKSVSAVWEEETGIRIRFIPVDPAQTFAYDTRLAATRDESVHVVPLVLIDIADLAEAGLLLDLSEFVDEYRPDWNDPQFGHSGGEKTTKLFNYYRGRPYAVSQDCDVQVCTYRQDLIESEKEGRDFRARYGYDLAYPETWEQWRDVAEHFHRPDQPLYGAIDMRSPFWGWINFIMRYVSTSNPVQYYFDDDMTPLINSDQGRRALENYVETTKFGGPDPLTWIWSHEYEAMGAGRAVMCTNFPNVTKFVKEGSPLDKGFGKDLTSRPMPGWEVDGTVVRHPSIYQNNTVGINAAAPEGAQRAAYLLLQWLSSGQMMTWLGANPGGYQDPGKVISFDDPLVEQTYGRPTLDALEISIPATAPPPSQIKGTQEYIQVLDINLQKVLSGQASIDETLGAIADGWNKVTDRHGRETQADAWVASKAAWPTEPSLPSA